jgi:hypothetical protein
VVCTTISDLIFRFLACCQVTSEGGVAVGYSGESRMLWGLSMWDVGGGGGCEAGREFWNGLGFEYLTLFFC